MSSFIRVARLSGLPGLGSFWRQYMARVDPFCLPVSAIRRDLWLRRHNSDLDVLWEVFGKHECDVALQDEPRFIIDGGAYAGYTTACFAHRYPDARIVAIEPDPDNFKLLSRNCAPYQNVSLVNKALWHTPEKLALANSTSQSWSIRARVPQAHETGPVQGVTIPDLMRQFDFRAIDILKLDIEGAETSIFSHKNNSWLGRVNVIIIETHGKDCEDAVFKATAPHGYTVSRKGEKKIFARSPRAFAKM